MAAPESESSDASTGSYSAATQAIRTTARWLLTAAAGVGAALLAGLQLTSLGSLTWSDNCLRIILSLLGLLFGLSAICYMIWATSLILTDAWTTLAQLHLEKVHSRLRSSTDKRDRKRGELYKNLYDDLNVYQDELYGEVAESITDLYGKLAEANRANREKRLEEAKDLPELRRVTVIVVQYANYYLTREMFKNLRPRLLGAAAVAVAGIVVFAIAANPPESPNDTKNSKAAAQAGIRARAGAVADSGGIMSYT